MSYKKKNILFMAQLCAAVYNDSLPENEKIEYSSFHSSSTTDCQMYIVKVKGEDTFIIAFRGSESKQDWIQDFKFGLTDLSEKSIIDTSSVKIHRGFNEQYESVKPEIFDFISDYVNFKPETKLIITGHSLGAGLSIITALSLKLKYPMATIKCYTFGSPRAGNKSFSVLFNRLIPNCVRVVNNNDPVQLVPTALLYRHIGSPIILRDNKVVEKYVDYVKQVSTTLWAYIKSVFTISLSPRKEHAIEEYIKKIEEYPNEFFP
jgi:hypothetical protein